MRNGVSCVAKCEMRAAAHSPNPFLASAFSKSMTLISTFTRASTRTTHNHRSRTRADTAFCIIRDICIINASRVSADFAIASCGSRRVIQRLGCIRYDNIGISAQDKKSKLVQRGDDPLVIYWSPPNSKQF